MRKLSSQGVDGRKVWPWPLPRQLHHAAGLLTACACVQLFHQYLGFPALELGRLGHNGGVFHYDDYVIKVSLLPSLLPMKGPR